MPYTVTGKVKQTKQPRGGYINPKLFKVEQRADKNVLNSEENINPILIGTAVDYLTRFMVGCPVNEAFSVSLKGTR